MNGRQLREYKGDKVIKYAYNIDGIRDQKVVDDVITNYFTEGNKIIFETTNKNMIYYIQ